MGQDAGVRTPGQIADLVDTVLALPLHRSLGIGLTVPGDPTSGLRLEVGEAARNPGGVLHGGLVPLLVDVTCFLRLLPELLADRHAVTVSSTASLLAAVPAGGVVTTTARVDRLGRTQAFLSGELRCGDRLVATGQVVKAVVPA